MLDEDGNEILEELDDTKINVETVLQHTNSNYQVHISLSSMVCLVAELYEKGIEMGWETKILDAMTDELRKLNNA